MPITILFYTIIITFYVFIDVIPILSEKKWIELCFCVICIIVSFIIDVLMAFEVKIPSPAPFIKLLISYFVKLS